MDARNGRALVYALAALLAACSGAPKADLQPQPSEAQAEIDRTKQAADNSEAVELPPVEEGTEEAAHEPTNAPAAGVGINAPGGKRFPAQRADEAEPEPPSLFEAAQAERERRRLSDTKPTVITNENLEDFAVGGQLSELRTEGVEDAPVKPVAKPNPVQDDPELYWRTVARDARLAWRAAADRVTELEGDVARLRFEFYSQDDPHYRDGEIKPAWDRAVRELEQARLRVSDLKLQVERVLEAGYQAGALPGWLREGMEFEPESEDADEDTTTAEPGELQVIEPPIVEDPPR
jgi:hypothetical protein